MTFENLLEKYDVPGPRYTSYPTVPHWDADDFTGAAWADRVRATAARHRDAPALALYVHLPFCESLCTFCGCTKRITRNHEVEAPYVATLLDEWRLRRADLGAAAAVAELHLGGGTPTFFSPDSLERLIEGLLADTAVPAQHEFGFEAHPNSTDVDHLKRLHGLGFRRLSLGVQDFDPAVQHLINRIQPPERVRRTTLAAREIGFDSVGFDLVYGLPGQSEAGLLATVDTVIEMAPDRIAFYGYAHVPWIKGVGQRRFSESDIPRGAAKRHLYEVSRSRLMDAGYEPIGMDHFARPGDGLLAAHHAGVLNRNFMGYTTTDTPLLVGLGMSAISDADTAFAQNDKTVEGWRERIAAGEPAYVRGHLLDEEDLAIRAVITDLMCRFRADTEAAALRFASVHEGLEGLREFEADGLVVRDGFRVEVTALGQAFVRNVCMAFDARLRAASPESRLFSQAI